MHWKHTRNTRPATYAHKMSASICVLFSLVLSLALIPPHPPTPPPPHTHTFTFWKERRASYLSAAGRSYMLDSWPVDGGIRWPLPAGPAVTSGSKCEWILCVSMGLRGGSKGGGAGDGGGVRGLGQLITKKTLNGKLITNSSDSSHCFRTISWQPLLHRLLIKPAP